MANNSVSAVSVLLKLDDAGVPAVLGGQTGASLTRSAETIDVTSKDSAGGYRQYVPSWKTWGVDADAFICIADAVQEKLFGAFDNGTEVDVELEVGSGTGSYTLTGKALITSLNEEYGQDGAVSYKLSLQGTGVLGRAVSA